METARNVSIPEMTEAISARLLAQWEGWKNQDPAPNNAIIADDDPQITPISQFESAGSVKSADSHFPTQNVENQIATLNRSVIDRRLFAPSKAAS